MENEQIFTNSPDRQNKPVVGLIVAGTLLLIALLVAAAFVLTRSAKDEDSTPVSPTPITNFVSPTPHNSLLTPTIMDLSPTASIKLTPTPTTKQGLNSNPTNTPSPTSLPLTY